jgi:hypothetical protein
VEGDLIPDEHHVARICPGSKISNGKPTGAAFQLRDGEEYVSVNWIEYFAPLPQADAVQKIREAKAAVGYTIGGTAKIAVLNVNELCTRVDPGVTGGRPIRVVHKPDLPLDPSHSGLFDTRDQENLVIELIATMKMPLYAGKI